MGRSTSIWGADAAKFRPSRWIDSNGNVIRPSIWEFHAFNGGPRRCLGENLAIFEAVAVLGAILRRYDLCFAPAYYESFERRIGEDAPLPGNSITCPMRDPFWVVVKARE